MSHQTYIDDKDRLLLLAPVELNTGAELSPVYVTLAEELCVAISESSAVTRVMNRTEKVEALYHLVCLAGRIAHFSSLDEAIIFTEHYIQIPCTSKNIIAFKEQGSRAFKPEGKKLPTWFTKRTLEWCQKGLITLGLLEPPNEYARLHWFHIQGCQMTEALRTRITAYNYPNDYGLSARHTRPSQANLSGVKAHPTVKEYAEFTAEYNDTAEGHFVTVDGIEYPLSVYAKWSNKKGEIVRRRLEHGVRLHAHTLAESQRYSKRRYSYQMIPAAIRMDANRFVHPLGSLSEIDITASQLSIAKHYYSDDKSPWRWGCPYIDVITEVFTWITAETDVKLIRAELKFLCGLLGVGCPSGRTGATRRYTEALRKGDRKLTEQALGKLVHWDGKSSLSVYLWETFYSFHPKLRSVMESKELREANFAEALQGIEGRIMKDVASRVGVQHMPLFFHDAIMVPVGIADRTREVLREVYAEHTLGGFVVNTRHDQHTASNSF